MNLLKGKEVLGKSAFLSASLVTAGSLLLTVLGSQASAVYSMSDGNSSTLVNPFAADGMYNWSVDSVNQLKQQWFWYRVGNSRENPINVIGNPTITQNSPSTLSAVYNAAGQFSLRIDYSLLGGQPGDGQSDITETITVDNVSGSLLNFHFFQFSDFNLLGTTGGDSVSIQNSGSGFYKATQTEGTIGISETIESPVANFAWAGNPTDILNALNDASATTLPNVTSYSGADAAWALQWDFAIAANDSALVLKDKKLSLPSVPEPSVLALVGLGLLGFACRRRQ